MCLSPAACCCWCAASRCSRTGVRPAALNSDGAAKNSWHERVAMPCKNAALGTDAAVQDDRIIAPPCSPKKRLDDEVPEAMADDGDIGRDAAQMEVAAFDNELLIQTRAQVFRQARPQGVARVLHKAVVHIVTMLFEIWVHTGKWAFHVERITPRMVGVTQRRHVEEAKLFKTDAADRHSLVAHAAPRVNRPTRGVPLSIERAPGKCGAARVCSIHAEAA